MKESDGIYKPCFKDYIDFARGIIKMFIKNCRHYKKMRFRHAKTINTFYMVFEPWRGHPGLADRMKAILSTYNLAKSSGYNYKLFFETPFKLSEYLTPKKNLIATLDELEYSIFDTKLFNERSYRVPKKLKPNKQYHCYQYSGNLMPRIFPDSGEKWCNLFQELFALFL